MLDLTTKLAEKGKFELDQKTRSTFIDMLSTFGLNLSQIDKLDWQVNLGGTSALFSHCVTSLRKSIAQMLLSPESEKELDLIELYLDLEDAFPSQNLM